MKHPLEVTSMGEVSDFNMHVYRLIFGWGGQIVKYTLEVTARTVCYRYYHTSKQNLSEGRGNFTKKVTPVVICSTSDFSMQIYWPILGGAL